MIQSSMAKIDSIKEKINILRDDYRNLFIFFMTVLTGSFTVFYQVVIGKLSITYSFIGIFGIIISLFILLKMNRLRYSIDKLINELEELK